MLEHARVMREIFPEIVYVRDFARRLYVIEDGAHFRTGIFISDRLHVELPSLSNFASNYHVILQISSYW
jgi:hypothetical protein